MHKLQADSLLIVHITIPTFDYKEVVFLFKKNPMPLSAIHDKDAENTSRCRRGSAESATLSLAPSSGSLESVAASIFSSECGSRRGSNGEVEVADGMPYLIICEFPFLPL